MKDKKDEKRKPPLAGWVEIAEPAILSTATGKHRFAITIKLPERSLKSATSFVKETNEALKKKRTNAASFVLVDSERARLQRATAAFATFKEADACLGCLADLGLRTSKTSAELEDFGNEQYDPWYETVASAWWPWLAAWQNPPPEMAMAKITNRLNLTEGSKYAEGAKGKLQKSDDADRSKALDEKQAAVDDEPEERRPKDENRREKKSRRAKE